MFYIIQVQYDNDDGMYHFLVGCVWGETRKEAYKKAQNLFSAYDITKFEMNELPLDDIQKKATAGGGIIAEFEDYVGI